MQNKCHFCGARYSTTIIKDLGFCSSSCEFEYSGADKDDYYPTRSEEQEMLDIFNVRNNPNE